jgi:hypothetical protein
MLPGLSQVVSTAEAAGRVAVLPSLADVQGRDFDTPHILIAERVGGMEDIPVSLLHWHFHQQFVGCSTQASTRPGLCGCVACTTCGRQGQQWRSATCVW